MKRVTSISPDSHQTNNHVTLTIGAVVVAAERHRLTMNYFAVVMRRVSLATCGGAALGFRSDEY